MLDQIKDQVLAGELLNKQEALSLLDTDLDALCLAADEIRRRFCGDAFDLCTIINGKSGLCSEDCKYCAQSAAYGGGGSSYPLLDTEALLTPAVRNAAGGILRYSIVTSGKRLSPEELDRLLESYRAIREACGISLCASHGLLNYEEFTALRKAGVTRYHNNLETSRRYFPHICTTHTYEDKLTAIREAQRAGLEVCSGGILGLGETMEDRIDLALTLRELGILSVPVNILTPVKGTPLEAAAPLSMEELRRSVALLRFLLPHAALRLAGGRGLLGDKGRSLFQSGANAAISGDMLTTSGICPEEDLRMLHSLGFQVKAL